MRRMLPMIVGLGTLQINTLLDGFVANWTGLFGKSFFFGLEYPLGEGALASITWAQRLYQFPLGVFGIAVATAIYPLLAKQSKDQDSFASTIQRGLRLVIFVGLPASVGLIIVREPLVAVVFQGEKFTSGDVLQVATILLGYATAVWAYSMSQVLTKGFYAKDDAMTPVKIAMFCVCLNFILNVLLIWTPLKASGLAWSTAICGVIQACILLLVIRKHVAVPVTTQVIQSWIATSILTLIMGGVVWFVVDQLWQVGGQWHQAIIPLAAAVGSGVCIFSIGSVLMKRPELHWALGRSK